MSFITLKKGGQLLALRPSTRVAVYYKKSFWNPLWVFTRHFSELVRVTWCKNIIIGSWRLAKYGGSVLTVALHMTPSYNQFPQEYFIARILYRMNVNLWLSKGVGWVAKDIIGSRDHS